MKDDIMRIMKMVEEGKIDSDKAADLIEAIKTSENRTVPANYVPNNYDNKMLKVRVNDGEDKVSVNLPIKVIKSLGGAIKSIPGVKDNSDIDIQAILEAVSNGLEGEIVNITSGDGETVLISIE